MKFKMLGIIFVFFIFLFILSAYTVDETEQVIVTRFDKVHREIIDPGLKFKIPLIEKVIVYPKNLQEWDGAPGRVPTKDKTFIWVDTFARWKIVEPKKFFTTVREVERGKQRLNEIIDPAVRNSITSNRLIETVRNSNRRLDSIEDYKYQDDDNAIQGYEANFKIFIGRDKIDSVILSQAKPKLSEFGIELVDVKFKRINYVQAVRDSVYKRMIAERKQIAEKFRSEGQGEANRIAGDKEKDLKKINSEAYKTAQEIKGEADALATRLYAESFGVDPEFYFFSKTLDVYKEALNHGATLILSTNSDMFKYLKDISGLRE